MQEAREQLPLKIPAEELEAHFEHLTPRYFRTHSLEHINIDLTQVNRFLKRVVNGSGSRVLEPVIAWHNQPARAHTSVKICTWDRPGLFTTISGALAASGLNILSARVFSRGDGIILDTFLVVDARTGGLAKRLERDTFKKQLTQALLPGESPEFQIQIDTLAKRAAPAEWEWPTRIRIDTEAAESRTIIEVEVSGSAGPTAPHLKGPYTARTQHPRRTYQHRERRGNRHLLRPYSPRKKTNRRSTAPANPVRPRDGIK